MMKIKNMILILIGMAFSFSTFGYNKQPIICKNFDFSGVRQKISSFDQKFQWNSPDCKIVYTRSLFPRKGKSGVIQFEYGLELFIYQNNQLKFICLPGWECKVW